MSMLFPALIKSGGGLRWLVLLFLGFKNTSQFSHADVSSSSIDGSSMTAGKLSHVRCLTRQLS
jgi:hypothetical protein